MSNLALKNLGANNKNSPALPPKPLLPSPVILLAADANSAALPLSINSCFVMPFSSISSCASPLQVVQRTNVPSPENALSKGLNLFNIGNVEKIPHWLALTK